MSLRVSKIFKFLNFFTENIPFNNSIKDLQHEKHTIICISKLIHSFYLHFDTLE